MRGEEFLILIGVLLCGGQAYTWYHFTQFRTAASLNIIGIITTYAEEISLLKEEVKKLKTQLKQYESGQQQSSSK